MDNFFWQHKNTMQKNCKLFFANLEHCLIIRKRCRRYSLGIYNMPKLQS